MGTLNAINEEIFLYYYLKFLYKWLVYETL